MKLRRATAEDAPTLARVHVDSWQVAYRGVVPDGHLQRFTYERREEAFRRALEEGTEETYLAEVDGRAVAILTIGASRGPDLDPGLTGEIWGIYISPESWLRGIGRKLVRKAEALLQSRGYQDVVLWVLEGNSAARRFYEAVGYVLDGMSKTVELGASLSAVRYRKRLEPQAPVA